MRMKVQDSRIIRNAAQCRKCKDVIESVHRHDFVSCKCGAIFIDGGREYFRAGGDFGSLIDLSKTEDYVREETNFEREMRESGHQLMHIKYLEEVKPTTKCRKHPRYKALRRPKSCAVCFHLWEKAEKQRAQNARVRR